MSSVERMHAVGRYTLYGVLLISSTFIGAKIGENFLRGGDAADIDRGATPGPEISNRLHEIEEQSTGDRTLEPHQQEIVGTLIERTAAAVSMQTESGIQSWPIAADAQTERGGESVSGDSIQTGDRVRAVVERRGDRQNGWSLVAVRLESDSVYERQLPDAGTTSGNNDSRPRAVLPEPRDTELEFRGTVAAVQHGSIRLIDVSNKEIGFPVAPSAVVYRDGELGDITMLQQGDEVRLIGTREGNRSDGVLTIINRIGIETPAGVD